MKAIRINTAATFDQTLQKTLQEHSPVFVLFFGNELPETSESWCPDCVIADPRVRKAVLDHDASSKSSALLEVPVGLRDAWRSDTNHYRSRFSLTAIPTLIHWTKSGPGERLVEVDCADSTKLQAFVEKSSPQD
ncbi:hypothetical protein BDB00DRAFT_825547 [Zychaea mexicana]|uniref:uncharacterized protein n=1 Tax=Zychaea mexicana TaxID=64656 RepID=UPI0022FEC2E4|nr:uncharacterized protein BDB00DRAFT_825547 [Zychaea mexicana]KAI9492990.1 hypothetical protein BDB00DRAFT_825547 [Zychaea mexicana]